MILSERERIKCVEAIPIFERCHYCRHEQPDCLLTKVRFNPVKQWVCSTCFNLRRRRGQVMRTMSPILFKVIQSELFTLYRLSNRLYWRIDWMKKRLKDNGPTAEQLVELRRKRDEVACKAEHVRRKIRFLEEQLQ